MAAFLTWALISLFLRYKEHPFVSVWGFQRESSNPPPGLTFCIPAKVNKRKLNNANPAYRLLAFGDEENVRMFSTRRASELNGFENYFDVWKRELQNISVTQARKDISFTKSEVFWYSSVFIGNRSYKLIEVLEAIDDLDTSCWKVHWPGLDTSMEDAHTDEDDDAYNEDENNYEMPDDNDNSFNNMSNSMANDDLERGENSTSIVNSTHQNVPKMSNPTLDSIVSQYVLSTPSTQPNQQRSSERPRDDRTDGPNSDERANKNKEGEDREGNKANRGNGTLPVKASLSQSDSIIFLVNIQQYNWISTIYFAGLKIYLHDKARPYWTEHPILLRPGTLSNIYYKTTEYKFLPLPYKSFGGIKTQGKGPAKGNAGCVDTSSSSFKNPMVSLPVELYSSEMCILETIMNRSTAACGCTVEKFYMDLHGTSECSVWKYGQCFTRVMTTEYKKLQRQLAEGGDDDLPCPEACRMTKYESTVTTANYPAMEIRESMMNFTGMSLDLLNDNVLMLSIQPQSPLSVTVEHVPELTLVGLVGSAGGWMGLCLGASLLSLTELFELLVTSVWILYRKLARRLRAQK
ncbi:acid-sensing ion channel 2-like [Elysia marginata]|uniref:Acid-sensing ion channel 2-like n=1 Tax=Elysia marginata TaxID=1093978 RepID=A0AAV4JEH6_9GAST|nr:acid-sensing ion channel 2-like [Elysia marginata]